MPAAHRHLSRKTRRLALAFGVIWGVTLAAALPASAQPEDFCAYAYVDPETSVTVCTP